MICLQCTYAQGDHVGPDCPMRKIGVALTFKGGCNLAEAKRSAKQAEDKRVASLPDVPVYPKGVKGAEKALQAACEGLLRQWGYRPSTAPEIVASGKPDATAVKGWYIHLWNCRDNPLLPDLLIFNASMTRSLAVELKVAPVYQPGQKEFINAEIWLECQSVEKFARIVRSWESSIKND